jgi:hypothetical protein
MKTITAQENQTLYDLAVKEYGTNEAVGEIFSLNPDIRNEPDADAFYFDLPVAPGSEIRIDNESRTVQKNIVKELLEQQITTWQELSSK